MIVVYMLSYSKINTFFKKILLSSMVYVYFNLLIVTID